MTLRSGGFAKPFAARNGAAFAGSYPVEFCLFLAENPQTQPEAAGGHHSHSSTEPRTKESGDRPVRATALFRSRLCAGVDCGRAHVWYRLCRMRERWVSDALTALFVHGSAPLSGNGPNRSRNCDRHTSAGTLPRGQKPTSVSACKDVLENREIPHAAPAGHGQSQRISQKS